MTIYFTDCLYIIHLLLYLLTLKLSWNSFWVFSPLIFNMNEFIIRNYFMVRGEHFTHSGRLRINSSTNIFRFCCTQCWYTWVGSFHLPSVSTVMSQTSVLLRLSVQLRYLVGFLSFPRMPSKIYPSREGNSFSKVLIFF